MHKNNLLLWDFVHNSHCGIMSCGILSVGFWTVGFWTVGFCPGFCKTNRNAFIAERTAGKRQCLKSYQASPVFHKPYMDILCPCTAYGKPVKSDMTSDTVFTAHQGLTLAHLNINSLLANMDEFFLQHYRVDILVLTETKLDDSVLSNEISLPCYTVAGRKDRTRHGGGVICYARSHIQAKPLMNSGMKNAECLWTEILAGRHQPFVVGSLYRPPSASIPKFNVELDDELQRLPRENTETYLLGDFNLDVCTQRGTELLQCIGDHGLHQLFEIERTTATSALTIDLIFTSQPVTPLGIMDLVYCVKKCKSAKRPPKYV